MKRWTHFGQKGSRFSTRKSRKSQAGKKASVTAKTDKPARRNAELHWRNEKK